MHSLSQTTMNYPGYPQRAPLADEDDILSQSSDASGGTEAINFTSPLLSPVGPEYLAHSANQANQTNPRVRVQPAGQPGPARAPSPSCRRIFACCAKSPAGKFLGHGLVKGVAVFVPVLAYAANYADVGGHHDVAIGIGLGVWALSTAISVSGRPTCRSVTSVVAESVGYGVLGLLLGTIDVIECCMGRDVPDLHVQGRPDGYEPLG